jgi:choline dehydrogenase-like flavoprotein
MSIIDANQLDGDATVHADLCVVGAGAAGITLSSAFDGAPQSVCLLESGSYEPDEAVQSLYDLDIAGYPVCENFMARARYFGGTCNLWAGRALKLTQIDLEKRDWVPDSGWPISYAELDRYYEKAAGILRLPSDALIRDLIERRTSPFERALLDTEDLSPVLSLSAKRPLRFGRTYKGLLEQSRNLNVYFGANATEIMLNPRGDAVDELKAATLGGKKLTVRARRYVLTCGGLENARLLLVSRSVQKNGVGNEFDTAGRFFMDHPRNVVGTVLLEGKQSLPLLLGRPVSEGTAQLGIRLSDTAQRSDGLLNSYVTLERRWSPEVAKIYEFLVRSMKILLRKGYAGRRVPFSGAKLATIPQTIYLLSPRQLMPHSLYRVLKVGRETFGGGPKEIRVTNHCEQAPNRESRVYLSEERDVLNMNRLVLDWRVGPEVTRTLMRLHEVLDVHLRKKGLGRYAGDSSEQHDIAYLDAAHHMGTTRMSLSARSGVVDANCRVHGVENLFIAGSSVFPTSGHANPTWTIIALTLRLCDHLKRLR